MIVHTGKNLYHYYYNARRYGASFKSSAHFIKVCLAQVRFCFTIVASLSSPDVGTPYLVNTTSARKNVYHNLLVRCLGNKINCFPPPPK